MSTYQVKRKRRSLDRHGTAGRGAEAIDDEPGYYAWIVLEVAPRAGFGYQVGPDFHSKRQAERYADQQGLAEAAQEPTKG